MMKSKSLFGAAFSLLLLGGIYVALAQRTPGGWFQRGRCTCGHTICIHISGNGYFTYAPGHGVPENLDYNLRRNRSEWEMVSLRPPDWAASPIPEGTVVGNLRVQHGSVYERWGGGTNWTKLDRVHFPFEIWAAKIMKK